MFYRLACPNRINHVSSNKIFSANGRKGLSLNKHFISNLCLSRANRETRRFDDSLKSLPRTESINSRIKIEQHLSTKEKKFSQDVFVDVQRSDKSSPFNVTFRERAQLDRPSSSPRDLIKHYVKLTKPNLTILVTLSSICSYAISPNVLSIPELAFLTIGTALCSGSANAINMGREPEFDRKMTRTSTRPVVTGKVSPSNAYLFAAMTGLLGTSILYAGVNPSVAFLGVLNIGLYGWMYTSLKRRSILNTWVGAVVGAIPPLMGWAASTSLMHPGAWCLAALLYAWQFPHFNSLSHNVADQYKGAGYVMAAAENPKLNARVALRYSLLMFPICFGLSFFQVTDWVFPFDSGMANFWLTFLAFRFWRQQRINHSQGYKPSKENLQAANKQAKNLFWCSVWQLPAVLVLAMLHKKGQWDRLLIYVGWKRPKDVDLFGSRDTER